MHETITLPVKTYLYGTGAERSTEPRYVVVQERQIQARELIAEYVRAELGGAAASRAASLALAYLLADNPRLEVGVSSAESDGQEVERACAALAERRYMLFVDGNVVGELDALLTLTERSQVSFVRLLPMIGG